MTTDESPDYNDNENSAPDEGLAEAPAPFDSRAVIPLGDQSPPSSANAADEAVTTAPAKAHLSLLVVEDEEADIAIIAKLLARAEITEFSIDAVADGDTGIERLKNGDFDACLVDYRLPGRDGLDFVRLAQRQGLQTPIILMTGVPGPNLDLEAAELGVADFIDKEEFDTGRLERSIRFAAARKQIGDRITQLSQFDDLTGLANRTLLHDRLAQALASAKRQKSRLGVLVLDLDRFKNVNDRHGHIVGDRLLQEVAKRLTSRLRECDTVARPGGDEFTIIVERLARPESAGVIAEKIHEVLTEPVDIGQDRIRISASIGIALFPHDASTSEQLLGLADSAMYRAKGEGGNCSSFSDRELENISAKAIIAKTDIKSAFERSEFQLGFRPQVSLRDNRVGVGVSAIWDHHEQGRVDPIRFHRLAEESGILEPITDWMIDSICQSLTNWRHQGIDRGIDKIHIAMPLVSRRQVSWKRVGSRATDNLLRHALMPKALEFEISEQHMMQEIEMGGRSLAALAELGLRICVDQFASGAAAATILRDATATTVRLHPSTLPTAPGKNRPTIFWGAITSMAKAYDLRVVATGIKNRTQLDIVRGATCDAVECPFGTPPIMSAEECLPWLRTAISGPDERFEPEFFH